MYPPVGKIDRPVEDVLTDGGNVCHTFPPGYAASCQQDALRDTDIVDITTIAARTVRLIVAQVDASHGFAVSIGTEIDGDMIPTVHGQVITLVGRMRAVAILIDGTRIA